MLNHYSNPSHISRLVLGTAQLGMNYGIANKCGRPDSDLAKKIVQTAWENGIREYDTAQGYGESENVLGNALHSLGFSSDARVITKLDPSLDHLDRARLEQAVRKSLTRLNVPIMHGLMLHKEEYLEVWESGMGDILRGLIKQRLTEHIGASVYSPEKAKLALETDGIDMIQIPSNILDRRFEKAGVFQLADDVGKTIYIRSIFLQGLLLMPPDALPEHMRFAAPVLGRLTSFAQDVGLNIMELCIGYIKHAFPRAQLLFGAETPAQVRENLKCWNMPWPSELMQRIQREFENINEIILNPSLWPKGNDNTHP